MGLCKLILVSLFLICLTNLNAQEVKFIYVGDPMCSWCYGFAPELSKVITNYNEEVGLELVMGGLRPYYDEKMSAMKDFLSHHWDEVHKASGQPFSYGILDREDLAYDTEPPARAVVVVRRMSTAQEYPFFVAVQRAFYYENKDMNLSESYHAILEDLGLSTETFDALFSSDEMKTEIKKDFLRAEELMAPSFPTLFIQKEGEAPRLIARGYTTSADLIPKVNMFLKG